MRVYRVEVTGENGAPRELLVEAGNPAQALRIATESICTVEKASQADLIRLTKAGVEVLRDMPDGSAPNNEPEE